jgi:7-cyano-7-deazaguanine synthase
MIMLSVAVAWAITQRSDAVAFAAHHGYHTLYPDCTPEFVDALALAVHKADDHRVELIAPFAHWTKADIVRRGSELGVPFELTWSCYEGGEAHCGLCGTCVERREAFLVAGVSDPTQYVTID